MRNLLMVAAATVMLTGCFDDDDDYVVPDAENMAPEAVSESFSTQTETAFSETLTATDEEGDALTFVMADGPVNGSVEIAADGNFTYTPVAEYAGEDSFTFTVTDGVNEPVEGMITIMVEAQQVNISSYTRAAFEQESTDTPLPLNGREFTQDVEDPTAFDDLINQ